MAGRAKHVVAHVAVEIFFALLPLLVLGANWPNDPKDHPHSFMTSPEWPMTACILYGLTVVRMLPAFHVGSSRREHHEGAIVSLLVLLPMLGVICSVILIGKLSTASPNTFAVWSSYVNICAAVICFAILGGYGIRSEKA